MAVSKRDVLTALSTMTFNDVQVGDTIVTADDITNYIETSIVQLDKRAESAAKRANEKKIAGDELRANIKAVIEESPKTIIEIITALDDNTVTSAKVVARLSQLIKAGEAFKTDTRINGRPIKIYSTTPFKTTVEE